MYQYSQRNGSLSVKWTLILFKAEKIAELCLTIGIIMQIQYDPFIWEFIWSFVGKLSKPFLKHKYIDNIFVMKMNSKIYHMFLFSWILSIILGT